jgi:MYXO-CTERM domain-containing protein
MKTSALITGITGALALSASASAALITDAAGDTINGFNAATNPDLDVLSAEVIFNNVTNTFTFTSTLAGNVGTTATASFVWGVNRGAGTAGFAANGLNNVLFDRVVRLVPGGTSQIAGGGLPAINLDPGAVTISGSIITAVVPASLLPSTGFTPENYTVNLWPRVASPAGFAGISDFAPNNSNASVTVVPAPGGALALAAAGLLAMRRRSRA